MTQGTNTHNAAAVNTHTSSTIQPQETTTQSLTTLTLNDGTALSVATRRATRGSPFFLQLQNDITSPENALIIIGHYLKIPNYQSDLKTINDCLTQIASGFAAISENHFIHDARLDGTEILTSDIREIVEIFFKTAQELSPVLFDATLFYFFDKGSLSLTGISYTHLKMLLELPIVRDALRTRGVSFPNLNRNLNLLKIFDYTIKSDPNDTKITTITALRNIIKTNLFLPTAVLRQKLISYLRDQLSAKPDLLEKLRKRGSSSGNSATFKKIAKVLGCSPEELLQILTENNRSITPLPADTNTESKISHTLPSTAAASATDTPRKQLYKMIEGNDVNPTEVINLLKQIITPNLDKAEVVNIRKFVGDRIEKLITLIPQLPITAQTHVQQALAALCCTWLRLLCEENRSRWTPAFNFTSMRKSKRNFNDNDLARTLANFLTDTNKEKTITSFDANQLEHSQIKEVYQLIRAYELQTHASFLDSLNQYLNNTLSPLQTVKPTVPLSGHILPPTSSPIHAL